MSSLSVPRRRLGDVGVAASSSESSRSTTSWRRRTLPARLRVGATASSSLSDSRLMTSAPVDGVAPDADGAAAAGVAAAARSC